MVVDNEINLFGIEKVTAEEFQRWSIYLSENAVRRVRYPGMVTGMEAEGLVVGPQDIDNFYFQSFLQRFRGHFTYLDDVVKQLGFFSSGDTIPYSTFFPKHPSKMSFEDYIFFFSELLKSEGVSDSISGDLRSLNWYKEQDMEYFRNNGLEFKSRCGGNHGEKLFYFTIDPIRKTSAVFYSDTLMEFIGGGYPISHHFKKRFEGSDNPFATHETISFIGHFGNIPIPLVNVKEFNLIHGYDHDKRGDWGPAFKTITYSKESRKEHVLPHDRFVI